MTQHNRQPLLPLAILLAAFPLAAQAPAVRAVAVVGVTVIDPMADTVLPGMTVVTDGPHIVTVGPAGSTRAPRGALVLDGRGRYLIPGLWDMHVHMASYAVNGQGKDEIDANADYFLPLFVAMGVTGVRDMAGELDRLLAWRKEVRSGARVGPRMFVTGWKVGGDPVVPGAPDTILTAADIDSAVHMLKRGGADFIKVEQFRHELWPELARSAKAAGLPFLGHLSMNIPLDEVSRLGFRSGEHMQGVLAACSTVEPYVTRSASREGTWWGRWLIKLGVWSEAGRQRDRRTKMVAAQDSVRCAGLASRLAANGTWLTPTLVGIRAVQRQDPPPTAEERGLLPGYVLGRALRHSRADNQGERDHFAAQVAAVGWLGRAGAPLLAGTDLPGTGRVPGISLVDELGLMVSAGLTPMRALVTATAEPARYFGAADSLGGVSPGMVADLVLLRENPLDDIANLRTVEAVVVGGRPLPRPALDSLLAGVRNTLDGWRRRAAADSALKRSAGPATPGTSRSTRPVPPPG